jgi:hypothetical protein
MILFASNINSQYLLEKLSKMKPEQPKTIFQLKGRKHEIWFKQKPRTFYANRAIALIIANEKYDQHGLNAKGKANMSDLADVPRNVKTAIEIVNFLGI